MTVKQKFDKLVDRLELKVKSSATPVKGFVVGLSGTDSIITFILLNEVSKRIDFQVHGIHCMEKTSYFQKIGMFPWIKTQYPDAHTSICDMLATGNHDQFRWAQLHYYAANNGYWVSSTMNATEKYLGNYSIMNKSASIAPIQSLYKSEIIELCNEYSVPPALIELSKLPDCLCGRDEFAAENIELIDNIIRNRFNKDMDINKVIRASQYIQDTKQENDFKNRTPYAV